MQSEIRRLSKLGWMQIYTHPPFWPMRATSQGGTPRKYEDRWRRTSDGSAPHNLLFDSDSVPVVPLNVAGSEPRVVGGVSYSIPKERKPTPRQVMRDLAVLMHAATLTGEDVADQDPSEGRVLRKRFYNSLDEWNAANLPPDDPSLMELDAGMA